MADILKKNKSSFTSDPQQMGGLMTQMGKIPPQALDVEQAVLGALLLEKNALHRISDLLRPEMFYDDRHKVVFESILRLFQTSAPIDILTVKDDLRKNGTLEQAGGAFFLAELTAKVASAANIEYHARVIAEKYILRELIRISDGVIRDAYDETTDVFDLLDKAEQSLFEVSETHLRRNYMGMPELVMKTLERLEELKGKGEGITGISSGFTELDKLTSGWQRTDLVIVAARPAMGKTAFTLTVARNAAVGRGVPVAFFSLEMAGVQLTQRLICSEAELDAQKVRTGKLENYEWQQLISRVGGLSNAPIYIDDTPGISIMDLRAKCRRLKAEKGIQMVIIDYLQLMTGSSAKGGNREQEIAGISRSLKEIAKELDVCVIALSQLSRAVETRGGDKKPMLSDLRESGSIEQDADMVIALYRPDYYGFETDEEGKSTKGVAEVIILKQRNGPTGTAKMAFLGSYGKFADLPSFGGGGDYFGSNVSTTYQSALNNDTSTQNFLSDATGDGKSIITLPSKINKDLTGEDENVPF